MPIGKTIQIYCPTGEPRGLRIAEITTRIVQAVVVPRSKLEEALLRPELGGVGLYFLFGDSEEGETQSVYIGEAEDCAIRLKSHHVNKEFWNIALAIVSRTGSFTKAHIRLLEWKAIQMARSAHRYRLENGNGGIEPTVPEWMASDVAEIFETAEVLLSALGYPVFEPTGIKAEPEGRNVFQCGRGGAQASAVYNEDGLVVLTGSTARAESVASARETVDPKREELVRSGALVLDNGRFRFARDVPFSSPSSAAAVVTGCIVNGWDEWRDSSGRSLDAVYRRGADAPASSG